MEALKENLGFVLTCLAIFAGLAAVALIAEKLITKKLRPFNVRTIVYVGMFSALAGVLMLIEIPLFFAPPFYKLDVSEIPVLICAFSMGPVAGVVCELLKVLVKLLLKGTTTAFVGDFASFATGCSLVLPASIVYLAMRTKRGAVTGLIAGGICFTIFGSLFNAVYLLPKFAELYGLDLAVIVGMGTKVNSAITSVPTLVLFAVVPFNLLKALVDSVVTILLYKRVRRFIHTD